MKALTKRLTTAETEFLAQCEETIEVGLTTFIEVGSALGQIRENRLYRADYGTFEEYCAGRWGFTDRRARQLIEAAEIGTMVPVGNERQARELAKVPAEERAEVWQKAVNDTAGKPTAAAIRAARKPAATEPPPLAAPDSPAGLPTTASGPDLPPGQPGPSTSTEDGRAVARPGPLPPATEADEAPIGDGEAPVGAGDTATASGSAAVDALTSGVPIAPASGVGAAPPAPREGRAGGVTPVERMKAIAEQMFADGSVASVPDLVTVLAYLAVAVRSVPVDGAAAEDREVWAGDLSRIAASLQIFAKTLIE